MENLLNYKSRSGFMVAKALEASSQGVFKAIYTKGSDESLIGGSVILKIEDEVKKGDLISIPLVIKDTKFGEQEVLDLENIRKLING